MLLLFTNFPDLDIQTTSLRSKRTILKFSLNLRILLASAQVKKATNLIADFGNICGGTNSKNSI